MTRKRMDRADPGDTFAVLDATYGFYRVLRKRSDGGWDTMLDMDQTQLAYWGPDSVEFKAAFQKAVTEAQDEEVRRCVLEFMAGDCRVVTLDEVKGGTPKWRETQEVESRIAKLRLPRQLPGLPQPIPGVPPEEEMH